ncbi:MAG: phosphotransferase, partial [Cutibacterium granulosum]|nr:phosphotransferase [Cutibacterium granulosum]
MTHRSTADLGSLWAHMSAARWFSGKGRGGRLIALTALSPVITEPSVRHVIATVGYPEGPDEYYQLLLSAASKDDEDVLLVDSEGAWRDATNDADA